MFVMLFVFVNIFLGSGRGGSERRGGTGLEAGLETAREVVEGLD